MKQQILEIADTLDRMPISGGSWEVAEQISAVNGMLRLAEMVAPEHCGFPMGKLKDEPGFDWVCLHCCSYFTNGDVLEMVNDDKN